jgi:TPR repeat protein
MAHDVFISHSAKDKTTADAVCATLEAQGIRCWIAPRDVLPGAEWSRSIIEAIEQTKIMVLVFTAHANSSPQVRRELERAAHHNAIILPLRIEDVVPDKSLEYFIGNVHWLDAMTPPMEAHLQKLANTVKSLLRNVVAGGETDEPGTTAGRDQRNVTAGPVVAFPHDKTSALRKRRIPLWIWGAVVALSVMVIAGIFWFRSYQAKKANAAAAQADALIAQKDYAEAKPLADQACAGGSMQGCYDLGRMYEEGIGAPPDPGQARPLYQKACAGGIVNACLNLGWLYESGAGGPQDYNQAQALYLKACDDADGAACYDLGLMYEKAEGVTQNYEQASSLYKKACDAGVIDGCFNLGVLYEKGEGVAQDYTQADSLYDKSCDAGDLSGCNNLGRAYLNGTGFPEDDSHAHLLFALACDKGDLVGCANLGELYAKGAGGPRDLIKARALLTAACSGGLQWACDDVKQLK